MVAELAKNQAGWDLYYNIYVMFVNETFYALLLLVCFLCLWEMATWRFAVKV